MPSGVFNIQDLNAYQDLRNHGSSPHAQPLDYSTMANDVLTFCQKHSLEKVTLLGHSMYVMATSSRCPFLPRSRGGKVVSALALRDDLPKDYLRSLIVVDVAPVNHRISKQFFRYAKQMDEISKTGVRSRKEADAMLAKIEDVSSTTLPSS